MSAALKKRPGGNISRYSESIIDRGYTYMYPYSIMKCIYVILGVLFFMLNAVAADNAAVQKALDTSNVKPGCWVEYRVNIQGAGSEKLTFKCFVKLYSVNGEMLDFEYKVDGIGKRIQLSRNEFPLSRLVPDTGPSTTYRESTDETVVLTEMDNKKVPTTHDVWNYENGVTEVWHSQDVPFSVVRVVCKEFSMELTGFSWVEE